MIRQVLVVAVVIVVLSGCRTTDIPRLDQVRIGDGVFLALPRPPGYPGTRTITQLVDASYRERRQIFQSIIVLSRDAVHVVITLPSGPRLWTIDWTAAGVAAERSTIVPQEIEAKNILADLMILLWDPDSLNAALGGTATASETNGTRMITQGSRTVVSVDEGGAGAALGRSVLVNHDFDYRLSIQTISSQGP